MRRVLLPLLLLFLPVMLLAQEIRIGVLAKRGVTKTLEKWSPTAAYLNAKLPNHQFIIVPLGFDEVHNAVENREISFIIANSAYYVDMEYRYGISRVATLQNFHISGKSYRRFGGVIFTRSDSYGIRELDDLQGKRFAAVDPQSFGGWHMAWSVIQQAGIRPDRDLELLHFSGTHDQVVYDVLNGKVDAGTVRSDTLERMELEGKIRLLDFHILGERQERDFAFLHSTPLYPEWPIAKLAHVSNELAKEVAIAMMRMEPEEEAAVKSRVTGWSIPSNYQSVHDVLKELKIGPYEHLGEITLSEVIKRYWYYVVGFVAALVAALGVIIVISRLNRGLNETKSRLESEITEKDQAQLALKERSDELARANLKLQELDKLKSMFIASMSHEFRTPLNSIIGFTGVLLQQLGGDVNEKQKDFLNRIKHSGEHLLGLISDVIDISKIEAGRIEAVPESFLLDGLVNEAVDEMSLAVKKRGLQLQVEVPEGIEMYSDRRRLLQCMLNYLSNAVKYTERGKITITVQTDDDMVDLSVTDTGAGIAQEDIPKLFEAFERLETHLRVKSGGTGLGLYLTKKITKDLLGGNVYVNSEIGGGSVFGLRIPKRLVLQGGTQDDA